MLILNILISFSFIGHGSVVDSDADTGDRVQTMAVTSALDTHHGHPDGISFHGRSSDTGIMTESATLSLDPFTRSLPSTPPPPFFLHPVRRVCS